MIRSVLMCAAVVACMALAACNRGADRRAAVEQPAPVVEPFVAFEVEALPSGDGSQQWIGVYNSGGKTARFRMDFGAPETASGAKTGEGTILPEAGSDSSVLLANLQKALRAKTAPNAPAAKTSIPFTYVTLGDHMSQAGGGFNADPTGNWMAMKLIFGEGDRESQIVVGINAATKKGQFSMKDPRYGDLALAELAKAL